jgi:hypothetical protein
METNPTRHGLLVAVASASVTVAVAVTAGALTGYLHPPRAAEAPVAAAPDAAPAPRTVLVPIRPDGSAAGQGDEPALLTVRAETRHGRRERDDDDGNHRRHREEHDDVD